VRNLLVVALVLVWSCQKDQPPAEPVVEPSLVAEPEPEPEPELEVGYVTGTTGLRRQPMRDRRIEVDGKKISNWLATLHRGEKVTVFEKDDQWARVGTSADTEGWLTVGSLLGAEEATPATVLAPARTFARPDLVAVSGDAIPAGSLLFVTGEKAQFSRVDAPGRRPVWVESSALLTAANEVAASRLATRVLALEAKGDKEAAANREILESQFGDTRLVRALNGDIEPAAIDQPFPKVKHVFADEREYRFHLNAPDGTGVSLRLEVNGAERCNMVGRADGTVHESRGGKVHVGYPCVFTGKVDNDTQVGLRLFGYVIRSDGGRVNVDEKQTGSLADVYDADIDIDDSGAVELILAVACPWVWVTDDGVTWQRRVEIIQNLNTRAKEGHQRVSLGRVRIIDGQVRLQVREEKSEISYLDAVALEVGGRVIAAELEDLGAADGAYRVLRLGDRLELRFEVEERGVVDAWVHATGYYVRD